MGGAGAWHLGLHYPSTWCSVGPGAGFVDFYKYQKMTEPLPDYQDRTLRIYDATGYALNLANVPFITYGGELDPQLAASLTMQAAADDVGAPLQLLVGQGMGHKFDDDSRAETLRVLGRYASNPDLSFSWYDAAVLSQKIRQHTQQAAPKPLRRFDVPLAPE